MAVLEGKIAEFVNTLLVDNLTQNDDNKDILISAIETSVTEYNNGKLIDKHMGYRYAEELYELKDKYRKYKGLKHRSNAVIHYVNKVECIEEFLDRLENLSEITVEGNKKEIIKKILDVVEEYP